MTAVCQACPHHCRIEEGQTGICRARGNKQGQVVSLNYGKVTGLALDPIEKKPLKHFYPGSYILSVGSYGCNMQCPFCQNHEISMAEEKTVQWVLVTPAQLAGEAISLRGRGNIGVAFTYNEPCVGFEYVRDTARLVHEAGMKNVLVTNGYAEPWVEDQLLPWIDGMNIDLKGFTEDYYRKLHGDLETVKNFIRRAVKHCHVELTTLIIPGENDGRELEDLVAWVADINPDIPLHITRFFPRWKMADKGPTPAETIYQAVGMAKEKLNYVYAGNIF